MSPRLVLGVGYWAAAHGPGRCWVAVSTGQTGRVGVLARLFLYVWPPPPTAAVETGG